MPHAGNVDVVRPARRLDAGSGVGRHRVLAKQIALETGRVIGHGRTPLEALASIAGVFVTRMITATRLREEHEAQESAHRRIRDVVFHIERGDLLDSLGKHPKPERSAGQR